jgi:hypothetical protein
LKDTGERIKTGMMVDNLTSFEMRKLQIEKFIERANQARSDRIHEELKRLNMANPEFSLDNVHVDVYV